MRRAAAVVATLALAAPVSAWAATPRTSMTAVENDVMCTVCKEPLAVAQSLEADRERAFISNLIGKGYTKHQIEQAMVAQYGESVLALPPAHGFNLTVYILPPAVVVLGAAGLGFALPRWRRRTRAQAQGMPPPPLNPDDAHRLDEDLARHGG